MDFRVFWKWQTEKCDLFAAFALARHLMSLNCLVDNSWSPGDLMQTRASLKGRTEPSCWWIQITDYLLQISSASSSWPERSWGDCASVLFPAMGAGEGGSQSTGLGDPQPCSDQTHSGPGTLEPQWGSWTHSAKERIHENQDSTFLLLFERFFLIICTWGRWEVEKENETPNSFLPIGIVWEEPNGKQFGGWLAVSDTRDPKYGPCTHHQIMAPW